jgi:hypothetical protein
MLGLPPGADPRPGTERGDPPMNRPVTSRRPATALRLGLALLAVMMVASACAPASDGMAQPQQAAAPQNATGDDAPGDAAADDAEADDAEADDAAADDAEADDAAADQPATAGAPEAPANDPAPENPTRGDAPSGDELAPNGPRGMWEGNTFTDEYGRQTTLNADEMAQYRRSNYQRLAHGSEPMVPDYCIFDYARKYAETKPGGHHPELVAIYPYNGSGRASGTNWVQENYGMGSGSARAGWTPQQWAVSRVDEGWMQSGRPTIVENGQIVQEGSGHAENITNPGHRFYGMGVWVNDSRSTMIAIQQFATHWANTPGCPQPPEDPHPNADLVAAINGNGRMVNDSP